MGDDLIEAARRLSEQASIESRSHRMAPSLNGEPVALYNIEKDPLERVNLASRHPDVVAELMGRLDEYFKGKSLVIQCSVQNNVYKSFTRLACAPQSLFPHW